MARAAATPPIFVVYGEDQHQKATAVTQILAQLLPPSVDRSLALTQYEGDRPAEQGGPTLVAVLEDLATLPFLTDRRVVLIRAADGFIAAQREKLERYLERPSPTGVLVLECRAFPKTTRLYKAVEPAGGRIIECRKLAGRDLVNFVVAEAGARQKRVDPAAAARLVELVGQDTGTLVAEIEKLALYAADRPAITDADVTALVGQTREEKIFAVMDAGAGGRLTDALKLWYQLLGTDPGAEFKVVGGVAFKIRQWLLAQRMSAGGSNAHEIAPKVMMWGRERDLEALLRRLSPLLLRRLLAGIANLDSQAKVGARSIETGVELMLVQLAALAG